MAEPLDVQMVPSEPTEIPIDLKAIKKTKKQKLAEALAEASAYNLVGVKILKIKAKTRAVIGKEIDQLNGRYIGHGQLAIASHNSETSFAGCDKLIDKYLAENDKPDMSVLVDLIQCKIQLNQQLINTAVEHIKADKEVKSNLPGNSVQIPFPAGSSVAVAVGPSPTPQIENADSQV